LHLTEGRIARVHAHALTIYVSKEKVTDSHHRILETFRPALKLLSKR